ncbi:hypothetical protein GCM10011533_02160 [Streptosporangium jomthongense]|uniref:GNAT family N-acetyltransferase n=1 Tax=Marinobacter aromaticivorans TaxID=1494078 RepID=A0ABW2IQV0_9GAMM|nr:GNAT family N-acetyltransferase [Marinobacter aromaticivorans]GGE53303.1 hypothetical protein GCM10011533_02160 [Streptosporangium jomthongense]
MNTPVPGIFPLGSQHLPAAADLCALAMKDNPLHVRVFGQPDSPRVRRLTRLFRGLLAYVHRKGALVGAFNGRELVGVIGLLPPRHCKPAFRDMPGLLLALLMSTKSPVGLIRLAVWLGTWARIDPAEPHWHLGPLAVKPAWQGSGIGTQLMKHALHHGKGDCFYLETDTPANVVFYGKFGFSVRAAPEILSLPSWVMIRPGAAGDGGVVVRHGQVQSDDRDERLCFIAYRCMYVKPGRGIECSVPLLQNFMRTFFRNHYGGCVDIATGNGWHDGRVNNTKP